MRTISGRGFHGFERVGADGARGIRFQDTRSCFAFHGRRGDLIKLFCWDGPSRQVNASKIHEYLMRERQTPQGTLRDP